MKQLDSRRIILFDGVCNLCEDVVQFVFKHDRRNCFHFAALQSQAGQELLEQHGLPTDTFDSFVVLQGGKMWQQSDAALQVVRHLGPPWSWLTLFSVLPKPLRDAIYDFIAKNRYRWFGKKQACLLPSPDMQDRFLK